MSYVATTSWRSATWPDDRGRLASDPLRLVTGPKEILWNAAQRMGRDRSSRARLLRRMPPAAVCAEIGVWKGDFSMQILKHTRPKVLHLIDPWAFQTDFADRLFGGSGAKSQADMDQIYRGVEERLSGQAIEIHRKYSSDAAEDFADESLDWVYVDGNHHYDYVKADLTIYASKIRRGGYVTGDDYTWGEEYGFPVRRAVHEVLDEHGLTLDWSRGSQYALKKL